MNLYPDQVDLIARTRQAFAAGARAVVMQGPTGFGKTAAASAIIGRSLALGNRVVFGARLDAILDDTARRLRGLGVPCGIVQADRRAGVDPAAPVQVCSLQTLHARPALRPPADLLILDECHCANAQTVKAILAAYPKARILGLTATPQRGDGQPLGDVFQALVQGPSTAHLVKAGRLVGTRVYSPRAPKPGALGMDPLEAYKLWCQGRQAIVFAAHKAHAHELAAAFTAAGHPAAVAISADSAADVAARRTLQGDLASGRVQIAVTVRALLEGFDAPSVSAILLCQAMGTVGPFLQAVGRGVRTAPGKADCVVVDLRGEAVLTHGLPEDPRVWSLEGQACTRPDDVPSLRRCGACHAVFIVGPSRCPRCGSVNIIDPRPVRVQRAEFFEASGIPIATRAQAYVDRLAEVLATRGMPASLARFRATQRAPQWVREALWPSSPAANGAA